MKKVFIDGGNGTTGLQIDARLEAREDIELLTLPEESVSYTHLTLPTIA